MKGSIYVNHKCKCGGRFVYSERRNGCFCECGNKADHGWFVRFGRVVKKRFTNDFEGAQRFLTGVRYETDKGTFDARDYQASNPLGFSNQADRWLKDKAKRLKHQSLVNYTGYMNRAVAAWGDRNVKTILEAEIEDFLSDDHLNKIGNPIASKTRHELKSVLFQFFKWVCRRERLSMPTFPPLSFEMERRDVLDGLPEQQVVLEKVKTLSWSVNPKIWFGIQLLAKNPNVRPGELRKVKESDIRLGLGVIIIKHTKERSLKRSKVIELEQADIRFLRTLPPALPDLYFFRHRKGTPGIKAGEKFGVSYFNKWWKRACGELGIKGVTLYPGTKHTTVTAVSEMLSPEETRLGGSEHSTNSGFGRYLVHNRNEKRKFREAYNQLKGGPPPDHLKRVKNFDK
jgi:integrase